MKRSGTFRPAGLKLMRFGPSATPRPEQCPMLYRPLKAPAMHGTWTGTDRDSKLILSWAVSPGRGGEYAIEFMDDLRSRLANRVQITTDGHRAYLEAIEGAFGGDVDYAQLVKLYGPASSSEAQRRYSPAECISANKIPVVGTPDWDSISTSIVELTCPPKRYHRLC